MKLRKISYLAMQAGRRLVVDDNGCPNCGARGYSPLDRKAIVTELRECCSCLLAYRFPPDSESANVKFYQSEYEQGFTTDLPDEAQLKHLLETRFRGHEKDYSRIISLLQSLGVHKWARVFDFGCSWGYGSWQLRDHGYEVVAFEISAVRAKYARDRLRVNCFTDLGSLETARGLDGTFDVFFSNHVIEHVPKPTQAVRLARRLVKPGGLFVAVTPNGSFGFRDVRPESWHRFWGRVHPNLITDRFWAHTFRAGDHFIGCLPEGAEDAAAWAVSGGQIVRGQRDPELLCVARF